MRLIRVIATDVLMMHSLCVCVLVMLVSLAKMVDPIKMPFEDTHMGIRNRALE